MTIDQSLAGTHLVTPLVGQQHTVLVPVVVGLGLGPVHVLRHLVTLNPDPGAWKSVTLHGMTDDMTSNDMT